MKSFQAYIDESGNAVKGTSPINQENVAATLKKLYKTILPIFGLTEKDVRLLGSTGKKKAGESSGDIDLAVDAGKILYNLNIKDSHKLFDLVTKKLKGKVKQVTAFPGVGVVSFVFPIENTNGNQTGETVQTDFMVIDDINLAAFTFWSPTSEESKYKGFYRNIMLAASATHLNLKILKKGYNDKGEEIPVTFERNFMDNKRGLIRGLQTRIGKTGKLFSSGRKKTLATKVVADTPEKIVQMLYGPDFGPENVRSFEAIIRLLDHPKNIQKKNKAKILTSAAEIIGHIKGLVMPPELKRYAK